MHSLKALFVLTEPCPTEGTVVTRKRWDDADRKARSIIVQNPRTKLNILVSDLLEREYCSASEVWSKLEATYRKYNIPSKLNRRQTLRSLS